MIRSGARAEIRRPTETTRERACRHMTDISQTTDNKTLCATPQRHRVGVSASAIADRRGGAFRLSRSLLGPRQFRDRDSPIVIFDICLFPLPLRLLHQAPRSHLARARERTRRYSATVSRPVMHMSMRIVLDFAWRCCCSALSFLFRRELPC